MSAEIEGYLFLCLENGHYGIATDREGTKLPKKSCTSGWKFVKLLSDGKPNEPAGLTTVEVTAALEQDGYIILSAIGEDRSRQR